MGQRRQKEYQPGDIRRHPPDTVEYDAAVEAVQANIKETARVLFEAPLCDQAGISVDELNGLIGQYGLRRVTDAIHSGGFSYRLVLEGFPSPPPKNEDWVPD